MNSLIKYITILTLVILFTPLTYSQTGKSQEKISVSSIKIGMLLPLSIGESFQEQESVAYDIRNAITFAVTEFNQYSSIKVSLVVLDTKMDTAIIPQLITSLASDKNLMAIIGPVFSDEFLVASRYANDYHIPIISPTATGNGIALKGEYIFQANPDFITRAKGMALYSLKKLKYKTFASLAPNTSYGKNMTENFSKYITKNGGNFLGMDFYYNSSDIRKSMNNLCKKIFDKGLELYISFNDEYAPDNNNKLLQAGISKKIIDSLSKSPSLVSIYSLFGRNAPDIIKKYNIKTITRKYEVDLPIHSVDAFYIPITSKLDIKSIYAALSSYKITAKLLGTGDLYHQMELEATKDLMNGIIFDYDTYTDPKENAYKNFYKNYVAKTQKIVTKFTLYGYDTISLLLNGIKKGNISRKDIKDYLKQIEQFPAIHSKISLKQNRINSELNIMQFKNGKINRIDEISVTD